MTVSDSDQDQIWEKEADPVLHLTDVAHHDCTKQQPE